MTDDARTEAKEQPNQTARRRSNFKLWCFRLAAIALSILVIVTVEMLLVAIDVGGDLSLVVKVSGNPKVLHHQVNPRAEESYFAGRALAGPEPKRFDLPRPDGVFRIVVVGGSTVLGFPYPPELAFPRQMEVLLSQQNAASDFEVINLGMIAISSFSVADVVDQAVAMEPDLIIVHTGHNEFYGPAGVASTANVAPQALFSGVVKVRRLRLFQMISACFTSESQDRTHLMESLPVSVTIPLNSPKFKRAEEHYRLNLERIVATASSAGIPVVLTTVASNLSGHSPVSLHVPEQLDAKDRQRWMAFFDSGRQLSAARSWREALDDLERAKAMSGDSSLLWYRMGQCLEALGRYPESRTAFESARDLDGCRFRAPSSFGGIVRDIAGQSAHPRVFFVDFAKRLADEAGPKALGSNLFLEHVHYNLDGHRRLAFIWGHFIQKEVLRRKWDTSKDPQDSEFDQLLGLLPEDRLSGQSYALKVMNVFPMTKTFDVSVHREEIISKIKRQLDALDVRQQQVFAELSLDDMAIRLAEALGDHFRRAGQPSRELFYRRCDLIRRPWNPDVSFRLARCLAESKGRPDEAVQQCRRALDLNPQHAAAQKLLTLLRADSPARR